MAKGRVVFYEDPDPRAAPPRSVYTHRARRRRKKRHRGRGLLFALAALALMVYMLVRPYKEATKLNATV